MSSVINYKNTPLTITENGTKTLETAGTWVEGDLVITDGSTTVKVTDTLDAAGGTIRNIETIVGIDHWLAGGFPFGEITTFVTTLPQNICSNRTGIIKINAPYATTIGGSAFMNCSNLESVYMPLLNNGGNSYNLFSGCTNLQGLVLPSFVGCNVGMCQGDYNLEYIDFIGAAFNSSAFSGCNKLETIVLRTTTQIALYNASALSNTPLTGYGGTYKGHIYVPSALISSYQTATNWSALYANYPEIFQAIEGSEYETHYADDSLISTYGSNMNLVESVPDFFDMTYPAGTLKTNATTLPVEYYFANRTGITKFVAPNLTALTHHAFSDCTSLKQVSLPKVASIPQYAFAGCGLNTPLVLPSINDWGNNDYCLNGMSNLPAVDLGTDCTSLARYYTFQNDSSLSLIILRRTSGVVELKSTNVFNGTPFASGGTGGTIYVPSALINTYKSATNWGTFDGYGTITWKAIEGSQYETHYADGTSIS